MEKLKLIVVCLLALCGNSYSDSTLTGNLLNTGKVYVGSEEAEYPRCFVEAASSANLVAFGIGAYISAPAMIVFGDGTIYTTANVYATDIVADHGLTAGTTVQGGSVKAVTNLEGQVGTSGVYGNAPVVFSEKHTTTGNIGGGNDTLWSSAIAPQYLTADGQRVALEGTVKFNGGDGNTKLQVILGSTVIGEFEDSSEEAKAVVFKAMITRDGSSSERCTFQAYTSSTTWVTYTTASVSLGSSQTLYVKGENTGAATDAIQLVDLTATFIRPQP